MNVQRRWRRRRRPWWWWWSGGGGGGFIFNKKERKALEWGVLPAAPIIPHIWGRRITPVAAKATAKAIGCADRRGNPRLARTDMPIIDWEKIFAGYNAKTNQGCG